MTYETAKKLKDAGFPQKDSGRTLLCSDEYKKEHPCQIGSSELMDEWVSVPSLSEMIEACGEKINDLTYCGKDYQSAKAHRDPITNERAWGGWEASTKESDGVDNIYLFEWGFTPEEAVANLWLELHK